MASETYKHEYPLEGGSSSEVERLRNQHQVLKHDMGGKLILAPIDLSTPSLRILDSGTLDGTWIQDVASKLPASAEHELYGTDINLDNVPKEPPAGTTYQIQDVNKPWPDEWKGSFDFVHQRLVVANAGSTQKEAIQGLAALVKPGGWIQLVEVASAPPDSCGPLIHDFFDTIKSIFAHTGVDTATVDKMGGWLEEVGFVDVQDCLISMRLGAANPDADLARRGVSMIVTAAKSLAAFGKSTYWHPSTWLRFFWCA